MVTTMFIPCISFLILVTHCKITLSIGQLSKNGKMKNNRASFVTQICVTRSSCCFYSAIFLTSQMSELGQESLPWGQTFCPSCIGEACGTLCLVCGSQHFFFLIPSLVESGSQTSVDSTLLFIMIHSWEHGRK